MQHRHASPTLRSRAPRAALATLAAAAALCAFPAGATEVGPYFQGYAPGTLTDARTRAGMDAATLAFGITRGSCALDSYLTDRMADARAYVAAGGRLAISMGGADGVYAEVACSDDQLFALVDRLITASGAHRIDWDVEGHQLNDTNATARRNRVLLRLQARHPNVKTSFTLPAWINGLQGNGMALMRSTIAAGVRIDLLNVMTMSFGRENLRTMVSPSTVAQASIMAYNATERQLVGLYPNKTSVQINAMMGMTPMIGTNDDGATFTLADARTVADFVRTKRAGLLSYWAFQRDRAQSRAGITPLDNYSGVVQSDYQFLNIFKTAKSAPAPVPNPVPAPPPPAPVPKIQPVVGVCAAWTSTKRYAAGEKVARLGRTYVATMANENSPPEWTPTHWGLTTCSAPVTYAAWVQGRSYAAGAIVTYNGRLYRAKYANPGYNPTISTYYWAPFSG